jgi:hypothetical protein
MPGSTFSPGWHPLGTPCGAAQPGTTRNGPDIISVREKTEDQCKAKKLVTQLMVTITCIRLCGGKIRADNDDSSISIDMRCKVASFLGCQQDNRWPYMQLQRCSSESSTQFLVIKALKLKKEAADI